MAIDNTTDTQNDNNNSTDKERENLALVYQYTESFLKQCDKNQDDLNSRLTTFLGFGGILLRFGLGLPDECRSYLLLKIIVLFCTACSIYISGLGLLANPMGQAIKARSLMTDEWFEKQNEVIKASIISTWINSIEALELVSIEKQKKLNQSIRILMLSVIAFSIDAMISAVFGECAD